MDTPSDLRAAAERYRRMAQSITDQRTIDALFQLAAEYEARAAKLDAEKKECASCGTASVDGKPWLNGDR